jgi:hypothetical protein
MTYEFKNSKKMRGMDGLAWSGNLFRDGVKVAYVVNGGSGAPTEFEWVDRFGPKVDLNLVNHEGKPYVYRATVEEAKLMEHIKGKTIDHGYGTGPRPMEVDDFVGNLADDLDFENNLKRQCKTKTLFRLKTDKDGAYHVSNQLFSKAVKDVFVKKYGDQIAEFINERFGQVADAASDEAAAKIRMLKECKNKTLFRLKTDKPGSYRICPFPFSKAVKDAFVKKYGDQIEEFLNEKLGQVAM